MFLITKFWLCVGDICPTSLRRGVFGLCVLLIGMGRGPSLLVGQDVGSSQSYTAAEAPILPGDRIQIKIWLEEDWSGEFPVDERGMAVLPRLGEVSVAGIGPDRLRSDLEERYSEYLRDKAVAVTVLRRISVLGEVRSPGVFWVDPTTRPRDLIALANGLTPDGAPDKISIDRMGTRIIFEGVDDPSFIEGDLLSGDQILVGRRSWIARNVPILLTAGASVVSIVSGVILAR